ncbi:hypothetical protein D3C84_914100 [compost metagenome]
MSIIDSSGDIVLRDDAEAIFFIYAPHLHFPEEYIVLKSFNPNEVEMSLTHRGRKPTTDAMVEFLIMQGFIKPRFVQ